MFLAACKHALTIASIYIAICSIMQYTDAGILRLITDINNPYCGILETYNILHIEDIKCSDILGLVWIFVSKCTYKANAVAYKLLY